MIDDEIIRSGNMEDIGILVLRSQEEYRQGEKRSPKWLAQKIKHVLGEAEGNKLIKRILSREVA